MLSGEVEAQPQNHNTDHKKGSLTEEEVEMETEEVVGIINEPQALDVEETVKESRLSSDEDKDIDAGMPLQPAISHETKLEPIMKKGLAIATETSCPASTHYTFDVDIKYEFAEVATWIEDPCRIPPTVSPTEALKHAVVFGFTNFNSKATKLGPHVSHVFCALCAEDRNDAGTQDAYQSMYLRMGLDTKGPCSDEDFQDTANILTLFRISDHMCSPYSMLLAHFMTLKIEEKQAVTWCRREVQTEVLSKLYHLERFMAAVCGQSGEVQAQFNTLSRPLIERNYYFSSCIHSGGTHEQTCKIGRLTHLPGHLLLYYCCSGNVIPLLFRPDTPENLGILEQVSKAHQRNVLFYRDDSIQGGCLESTSALADKYTGHEHYGGMNIFSNPLMVVLQARAAIACLNTDDEINISMLEIHPGLVSITGVSHEVLERLCLLFLTSSLLQPSGIIASLQYIDTHFPDTSINM